jgi:hypothetical protein
MSVRTRTVLPDGYRWVKTGEVVRKTDLYPTKGGTWEQAGLLELKRGYPAREGDLWIRRKEKPRQIIYGTAAGRARCDN